MGGRPATSAIEVELYRLLAHARGCDGFRQDETSGKIKPCSICNAIDRRLEDGTPYFADDPVFRMQSVDRALDAILKQQRRLSEHLEGAMVPHSTRQTALQLVQWVDKTRNILSLPITEIPGYVRDDRMRLPEAVKLSQVSLVSRPSPSPTQASAPSPAPRPARRRTGPTAAFRIRIVATG